MSIQSLNIVDSAGRTRIKLFVQRDTPQILILDEKGRHRLSLTAAKLFSTIEAHGGKRRPSVRMVAGEAAALEILDARDNPRGRFSMSESGKAEMHTLEVDSNSRSD